jgi:hypothetical protein
MVILISDVCYKKTLRKSLINNKKNFQPLTALNVGKITYKLAIFPD